MAKKKRDWKAQAARDKVKIEASGQDYYTVMTERRNLSQKRRVLKQWNPALEARAIQLFNEGNTTGDAVRILVQEKLYDPIVYFKGQAKQKLDNRGITQIFNDLREGNVVHPENQGKITFTEIIKGSESPKLASERLAQDKQILLHYLESPETFQGKPAQVLSKSFNARQGLTTGTPQKPGSAISPKVVTIAFE